MYFVIAYSNFKLVLFDLLLYSLKKTISSMDVVFVVILRNMFGWLVDFGYGCSCCLIFVECWVGWLISDVGVVLLLLFDFC